MSSFGISDAFGVEAVARALLGGLVLGATVVFKTSLTGNVLGVSGSTRGLLSWRPPIGNALFILGLGMAGFIARRTYGGFESMPPPAVASTALRARLVLGGILVGFGTATGNGCTSGHGLTGLARLALRSWVAVPTFMASGVAVATLSGAADVFPAPAHEEELQTVELPMVAMLAAAIVAGLVLCSLVATASNKQLQPDAVHVKAFAELCSGLAFGFGLVLSTMSRPSKVAGFLDLASGAWDPSLMFVMGGALMVTFPFFQTLRCSGLEERGPLLGGSYGFPPQWKPVDSSLVIGALLFGIGWGICGVCPGPMWVLVFARPCFETLLLAAGVVVGMCGWKAMQMMPAQPNAPRDMALLAAEVQQYERVSMLDLQELLPKLQERGVEVPVLPGDIATCGFLARDAVADLAAQFRGWLNLNGEGADGFFKAEIEGCGCQTKALDFELPGRPGLHEDIVALVMEMPRPLMVQCNSGSKASLALLLALASEGGRSEESTKQLAQDLDLKAFTRCPTEVCAEMCSWVLRDLQEPHLAWSRLSGETGRQMVVFEQLFDETSSTFTYLLGCPVQKEAVLIDPVLEKVDRDLAAIDKHGLTLKYVLNTHCHADHITGGSAIRALRPAVRTMISEASGAKADQFIGDKDIITFGSYSLQVIATPGHTDGCVSYFLRDGDKQFVFTGDALLIRGCGRTDFQQGDSRVLYKSVHSKLFTLPARTKVYPGHDYKGRNVSTIEEEKRFNPRLSKSEDEFVEIMKNLNLPRPKLIDVAVPANLQCGVQS
eukprot:TRINITY_DN123732_c0_g1_i1.p1 TRINITY_DN123732_c0_g1~~TRINITY_DN123732_c0_g1_i1.p1  ORF type:complete len:775 (-),score=191.53 TRINITY_DN123732_c0_g1_i1:70-2394(-)